MKNIISLAFACLNIPYYWGGKNPLTGFDCSGFSEWLMMSVGFDPPGVANAQQFHDWLVSNSDKARSSSYDTGAFCFYGEAVDKITHIAFMLNPHQIIEAGGGGSKTIDLNAAKQTGACVRIRPFGHRKDLVAVVFPNYPEWVLNEN